MGKYNDLDLRNWKRYGDIETDSLWIIKERDTSNGHSGGFHGNFVPQIPNQFLRRYTKAGEWVLDPFLGGGTTLIEARRLGRNAIGFEINPATAKLAQENIANAEKYGKNSAKTIIENVDSVSANYGEILKKHGVGAVQFAILHPPTRTL